MNATVNSENHMCENNCLCIKCPCLIKGVLCDKNCECKCGCKNCKNNEDTEERLSFIEDMLVNNSNIFAVMDNLTQEEYTGLANFTLLKTVVDDEKFPFKERNTKLSKKFTKDALRSTISTECSSIAGCSNVEGVENALAKELVKTLESLEEASK